MDSKRVIHIVDDDAAVRKSVSFMLKTSGYAVVAWESGIPFLKDARHHPVGCVLLDIRMPEMDGLDVQKAMAEQGIAMPVIVMTGHGDIAVAVRAMRQGAVDFIEKPFEKARAIEAIEMAFLRLEDQLTDQALGKAAKVRVASLTEREREVLHGLAQGLPNKTIAYNFGISPRTVEVHRANVMAKLGVRSFSDALRVAFAAGLGGAADA